jgi:GMP synthase-like glutamine amidotransferase
MRMKPVAIFRHSPTEGPGHFATYLDGRRIPWTLLKLDEGDAVPATPTAYSGLCFMGGTMSVNDDLPWIAAVLALIRAAVAADVPVIGHCLGGQLMSKALGGVVSRNPVKEFGWGAIRPAQGEAARDWLGDAGEFLSFHWHGETFTLPKGAVRLAGSDYCTNQAFVLGKHLGMQCHIEITPEMIATWCRDWEKEQVAGVGPSVQMPEAMQAGMAAKVDALHAVSERLYDRWTQGLV